MFPVRDTILGRNPPLVTWVIILTNGIVFLFELMLPDSALEQFFYLFGIVPARYSHPAWAASVGFPVDDFWPFFTSMSLHGGWMHIIGHMWTLWIFGDNVEDRMGPLRFLSFYLLCGLVAGVTHWLTNPYSTVPTVGASGAIAGVLGAYFLLYPRSRIITLIPIFFWPLFVELPAFTYIGFWILSQVFSATLSLALPQDVGGVAWWAHVGGFVAGVVLHRLFIKRGRSMRRLEPDEWGLEAAWLRTTNRDPWRW